MSKVSSISRKIRTQTISVHTNPNSESSEQSSIQPRFKRINSVHSPVSPDAIEIPKRIFYEPKRDAERPHMTFETIPMPDSPKRSFSFTQRDVIFITIGVLIALGTAITAIALALKYRT